MNALDQIYVSDCVTLGAELARQPWLSNDERMAAAIDAAVTRAIEDTKAEMVSVDDYEQCRKDSIYEGRNDAVAEVDRILDSFDCEADDYGARVVEAINAWIKENT